MSCPAWRGIGGRTRPLRFVTLGSLLALAPTAQAGGHVRASLVSDVTSISPGRDFGLAVRLQMEEGWHTYWVNPGDSGLATKVTWRLPEGLSVGPLQWPAPDLFGQPPVVSFGYGGEVLLIATVTPDSSLRPGIDVPLGAKVVWVECKDVCLPGRAEVELTLPVRSGPPGRDPEASRFEETRSRVPSAPGGWRFVAGSAPESVYLTFWSPVEPPIRAARFFPARGGFLDHSAPQPLSPADGGHSLRLRRNPNASGPTDRLQGVLVVEAADGRLAVRVDVPIREPGDARPPGPLTK